MPLPVISFAVLPLFSFNGHQLTSPSSTRSPEIMNDCVYESETLGCSTFTVTVPFSDDCALMLSITNVWFRCRFLLFSAR